MIRWAIGLWIVVVVVTVLASGYVDLGGDDAKEERPPAPAFSLVRLDGVPTSLADHRGKTLILDFWATWCKPCEVQMPILDALWERRGGRDLAVLGLSVDVDPPEKVGAWLAERGISYPVAIVDQQLAIDYGAWAFPTLVVVDPAGDIVRVHQGVLSRPELEDLLDAIAAEFAGAGAEGDADAA